jgi:nucleoside 2-deoxyribosyltransferase
MNIVGGVYLEECVTPSWSRIFGSGGRAAAAVSVLSPGSTLVAYAARAWADDVRHSMEAFGVKASLVEIEPELCFSYFHPLSQPELHPPEFPQEPPLQVSGEAVLRFGFVEGDARIEAERAVFDPQNWAEALRFRENGSQAAALAVVLNETELALSTGSFGPQAVELVMQRNQADVVVVKRGARGALVYEAGVASVVPAYRSASVFKIGSGDVFSAVFAHHWTERGLDAAQAADAASQAVSRYVDSRNVQADPTGGAAGTPVPPDGPTGPIYLAAPFFNIGQRWVVEEARRALLGLGAEVFSPLHDVGVLGGARSIAQGDLEGLRRARAVLAITDSEDAGTLFEVGYARDRDIPVVVLAESPRVESLTMLEGSGCMVVRDFSSAVFNAVWAAMR